MDEVRSTYLDKKKIVCLTCCTGIDTLYGLEYNLSKYLNLENTNLNIVVDD